MQTTQTQQPTNGQSSEQATPARNGNNGQATQHYVRPRANITETGNGFAVQVEMPGVKKDGVEITFENGELTLVGRRTPFETKAELIYRETHRTITAGFSRWTRPSTPRTSPRSSNREFSP
jgi:HSP20 family molecular chaperone IbpA